MTSDDINNFKQADNCHICGQALGRDRGLGEGSHCHFTGKFRGAAHNTCNVNLNNDKNFLFSFP